MNQTIIPQFPPVEPKESKPIRPPMVYIRETAKWQYKQVIRDLEKEKPLDESELNALGTEGWEMSGVFSDHLLVYYYFKRLTDK